MKKLTIICGNILDYLKDMDAIVNSNNKYMISGSGICGSIYKKAGKEKLEEYCKNNYKSEMKVNEIRITKGFDLGIDIIHIYCPKYHECINPINDLLQGYENIFINAKEKGYKNIISVSIGTGIHGYKHNEIGNILTNKLNELTIKYNINFTLVISNEMYIKYYNL